VEQRTYQGVTHEFFGMGAILEQAVQAQDFAASRPKQAFNR
jgi:acetyl esterase